MGTGHSRPDRQREKGPGRQSGRRFHRRIEGPRSTVQIRFGAAKNFGNFSENFRKFKPAQTSPANFTEFEIGPPSDPRIALSESARDRALSSSAFYARSHPSAYISVTMAFRRCIAGS